MAWLGPGRPTRNRESSSWPPSPAIPHIAGQDGGGQIAGDVTVGPPAEPGVLAGLCGWGRSDLAPLC